MSGQVARLVELGLVERSVNLPGGRAQVLAPSRDGPARLTRIRAARRARWAADLADRPTEDVATLAELLARINRIGEAHAAGAGGPPAEGWPRPRRSASGGFSPAPRRG